MEKIKEEEGQVDVLLSSVSEQVFREMKGEDKQGEEGRKKLKMVKEA